MVPSIYGENMFDDFFDGSFFGGHSPLFGKHARNLMKTDIRETDDAKAYRFAVELPGFQKDEIHVDVKDGYLTVSAQKGLDKDEEDKKGRVLRQERYAGACSRSFYVGDIRPEDIEMQVYRSSGAGGQHINKTSSAVRLIHKPTGIVVSCQTQRSQFQNRDYAMEMLKAKLYQIAKQQHMDKIDDIKGVQNEIAWGHQIRSYVFMPYTMVKDHRTNYETGNVDAVMDGDLDGFIFAYLKAASRGELQDT